MNDQLINTTEQEPAIEPVPVFFDIVIPYVFTTAIWDELKFALRSIERNAKFNYRVFLVADKLPDWANPEKVHLIKSSQIHGMKFSKAFDQWNKLVTVCNDEIVSDNFIYAYDDQLWMKPVSESTFERPFSHALVKSVADLDQQIPNAGANWRTLFINTIDILKKMGLPCFNFETHMPRLINKQLMLSMIDKLNLNKQSPTLASTLYYNINFPDVEPVLVDTTSLKGKVRSAIPKKEIAAILKEHTFIDYNNDGLTADFKKIVQERFRQKSSFEI